MTISIPQMALPEILPVFPLTGVLLLPGTTLPLHIFEERYRNMVEDALGVDRVFGMIQPFVPRQDNRPLPGAEKESPELYKIGCAGHIEEWEKFSDGRFFIHVKGVNRFRYEQELPMVRGYRRVKPNYQDFPEIALAEGWSCRRQEILEALAIYGRSQGMQVNPDQAGRFSDLELLNVLSVSLPFHPAERQALLEARTLEDREKILINLLRLSAPGGPAAPDSAAPPRTLN